MGISLVALAYIVVSSLSWSGLDVFRKILGGRMPAMASVVWLSVAQLPLFGAWLVVSVVTQDRAPVTPHYIAPAVTLVLLNVAASVMFIRAVTVSPLSLTIPLLSLTPVFATLMALILLGEAPSARQLFAIGVIVAGALVLNPPVDGDSRGSLSALWRAFTAERGSVLMAMVAAIWGLVASLDKVALVHATTPFHGVTQNIGVGLCVFVWLAATGRVGELRSVRGAVGPLLGAGISATFALGLQLVAIQLTLVGLVETIKRAIGLTLSIIAGRVIFGEPLTLRKLCAGLAMAAGTALLVL